MDDVKARLLARLEKDEDPTTVALLRLVSEFEATRRALEANGKRNGNGNGSNGKLLDSALRVLSALLVAAVTALVVWSVNVEKRVTLIESNRFTAENARQLEERIMGQVPPQWFREVVNVNTNKISELEARLRTLERGR